MDHFHHHLKILSVRINKKICKYLFSFKANRPGSKKYSPGISSPNFVEELKRATTRRKKSIEVSVNNIL
jgi:hypothetical protein